MQRDDEQLFSHRPMPLGLQLWQCASSLTRPRLLTLARQQSVVEPYFSLQFLLRYSEQDPLDLFSDYGPLLLDTSISRGTADARSGVLRLQKDGFTGYIAALPGEFANVWLLATDMKPSSDEYNRLFRPLKDLLSSRLAGLWLSNDEMEQVIASLHERLHCDITPGRVTSRRRDRSTVEYLHGTTVNDLFEELYERGSVLRSMDFTVRGPNRLTALAASVSRWFEVAYRAGEAELFDTYLLKVLEERVCAHVRRIAPAREQLDRARPITFAFKQDELLSREKNVELTNLLSDLPRVSVCAFHLNPYLHLAIADLSDGSTMDLFADDPSTLDLIPGKRCSLAAIARIFDCIYDSFAAGVVEPADPGSCQQLRGDRADK